MFRTLRNGHCLVLILAFTLALTLTLALAPAAQADEVLLPHLTGGDDDWVDSLQVDNPSLLPAEFTVTLYADGQQVFSQTYTAMSLAQQVIDLQAANAQADSGRISYSTEGLSFRLTYRHAGGGGLAEFHLSDTLGAALLFTFSDLSEAMQWKGLALANFGDAPAQVKLYAVGDGRVLDTADVTVPGNSRLRGVYQDWFPGTLFADMDMVVAVAAQPSLAGIVISGANAADKLLFSAAGVLPGFDPDALSNGDLSGVWDGEWRSNDGASGGLTIHMTQSGSDLSGTMDLTETDCGDMTGVAFSGSYDGVSASFKAQAQCMGSTAELHYTKATVSGGSSITGKYTIEVDGESYDSGGFNATKR